MVIDSLGSYEKNTHHFSQDDIPRSITLVHLDPIHIGRPDILLPQDPSQRTIQQRLSNTNDRTLGHPLIHNLNLGGHDVSLGRKDRLLTDGFHPDDHVLFRILMENFRINLCGFLESPNSPYSRF
jgi:hypothetical protein